ncbi:MAG: DegV family protein [Lachnospiraceae bacterium]|nr:DegV family protein [Lachnospiraceae bacterium]
MQDYVIYSDSACDVSEETLKKWQVEYSNLYFNFTGEEHLYENFDIPFNEFYDRMRKGAVAKTSAINSDTYVKAFRPILEAGKDILVLVFSSGLSITCQSAAMAADELKAEFPDRKIYVVDSLCASAGQGLFVYLTVKKREEGASLEEARDYALSIRPHLCHWFTVDDLVYLKRGGRVSGAAAFVGGILDIRPVLHVDDEGHLINMSKVRGRRKSIMALAEKYDALALDKAGGTVFISHADCEEDAKTLAAILKRRYGQDVDLITEIGPVIGAHSGPGTLALFFLGEKR